MSESEPLDPERFRRADLQSALRGYKREEVRRELELAADEIVRLRGVVDDLTARAAESAKERGELLAMFERAVEEQRALLEAFETLRREHEALGRHAEQVEAELERQREIQTSLTQAVVVAERQAADVRASAAREAEVIVAEARVRARELEGGAELARSRFLAEARSIRAVLQAALATLDEERVLELPDVFAKDSHDDWREA